MGFCGSPVEVRVVPSPSLKTGKIRLFARFELLKNSNEFDVGQEFVIEHIASELKDTNPLGSWMEGVKSQQDDHLLFVLNDRRQGWHYPWKMEFKRSKERLTHSLVCYVLEMSNDKSKEGSGIIIKKLFSPSFIVRSSRRMKSEKVREKKNPISNTVPTLSSEDNALPHIPQKYEALSCVPSPSPPEAHKIAKNFKTEPIFNEETYSAISSVNMVKNLKTTVNDKGGSSGILFQPLDGHQYAPVVPVKITNLVNNAIDEVQDESCVQTPHVSLNENMECRKRRKFATEPIIVNNCTSSMSLHKRAEYLGIIAVFMYNLDVEIFGDKLNLLISVIQDAFGQVATGQSNQHTCNGYIFRHKLGEMKLLEVLNDIALDSLFESKILRQKKIALNICIRFSINLYEPEFLFYIRDLLSKYATSCIGSLHPHDINCLEAYETLIAKIESMLITLVASYDLSIIQLVELIRNICLNDPTSNRQTLNDIKVVLNQEMPFGLATFIDQMNLTSEALVTPIGRSINPQPFNFDGVWHREPDEKFFKYSGGRLFGDFFQWIMIRRMSQELRNIVHDNILYIKSEFGVLPYVYCKVYLNNKPHHLRAMPSGFTAQMHSYRYHRGDYVAFQERSRIVMYMYEWPSINSSSRFRNRMGRIMEFDETNPNQYVCLYNFEQDTIETFLDPNSMTLEERVNTPAQWKAICCVKRTYRRF